MNAPPDSVAFLGTLLLILIIYWFVIPHLILKRLDRLLKLQEQQSRDIAQMRDMIWNWFNPPPPTQ